MQIAIAQRRPRAESIVPMINVVFLLLIFFLMTAQIAPPEPFEVEPPKAESEDLAAGTIAIYVAADGRVSFRDAFGDAAVAALAEELAGLDEPAQIRADYQVDAAVVAALLDRLRAAGIERVTLLTRPQ